MRISPAFKGLITVGGWKDGKKTWEEQFKTDKTQDTAIQRTAQTIMQDKGFSRISQIEYEKFRNLIQQITHLPIEVSYRPHAMVYQKDKSVCTGDFSTSRENVFINVDF